MNYAIDPATDLSVRPNPHARAACPYCSASMAAKCGDVVGWHWAHIGPTCQDWEVHGMVGGRSDDHDFAPRATCDTCSLMRGGACESERNEPRTWRRAWTRTRHGPMVVLEGAPQCPGFVRGFFIADIGYR
jgi:hypothetical protein